MAMNWPVVKEDLSEQSHRTASATSIGLPKRPSGCWASTALLIAGSGKARSAIGVSITAGDAALTECLVAADLRAAGFVTADYSPFVVAENTWPRQPLNSVAGRELEGAP